MALMHTQIRTGFELNQFRAPDFNLLGTDGKHYSLQDFKDSKVLIVIFMCNHCPYVIAVQDRINALAKKYKNKGVALVGINPNDPVKYPDDSYENMQKRAQEKGYVFPYLQDLSQEVAKDYDAVCTPDPYVFENMKLGDHLDFILRYHGRIDDSWKDASMVTRSDLDLAVESILNAKPVDPNQLSAMGCSIKWKT